MKQSIKLSGSLAQASTLFAGAVQKHKETLELSLYQQKLFSVALRGFDAFKPQELARMSVQDRKTIMSCYGKTKQVINELKQQYATNTISALFNKLFPEARGSALSFLMFPVQDKHMTTKLPLNVPKEVLIKRLIAENILPKDFLKCAA